ncbi:replication initiation protein [Paenibacillus allorhizosphaerae]|uniref:Initiator Rep protein WH1 domain-containing protein n=1 Tax=Paenibacillus allorhizosphaerae TaxID=2849866 RepID=A0ABM8VNE7_9BACL|nr:replication initiation protein [Paenibacillus allorhizosphaerae]CAG7651230.1 hypothetical protein PAECIP111802_04911 [Paenibacillus allorhizosphaerae]
MKNTSLVVKSNDLVEASYKLNLVELRIVFALIATVSPDDTNFKRYQFKVSDFAKLIGVKNKNIYTQIKEYTYGLMSKPFYIGENLQVNWLASAEYLPNEGIIELEFSEKLKPFLLQLKEKFTAFKLKDILKLKSAYSMRIYELMKQYEKIGYRQFTLEKLKKTIGLDLDEYPVYYDFKKRVILTAQKEINELTDINIEFEEIRESKKVTKIKFNISSKDNPKKEAIAPPSEESLGGRMQKFGLNEAQISEILNKYDEPYIVSNLDVVEQAVKLGKVRNVTAYTLSALRDDYRSLTPIELEKREEAKRGAWLNDMKTEYYKLNFNLTEQFIRELKDDELQMVKDNYLSYMVGKKLEATEERFKIYLEKYIAETRLKEYTLEVFLAEQGFYDLEKKEILYPEL